MRATSLYTNSFFEIFACFWYGIEGITSLSAQVASVWFVLFWALAPVCCCFAVFLRGETQIWLGGFAGRPVCVLSGLFYATEVLLYSLNPRCVQSSFIICLYQFQDRASELYHPHPGKNKIRLIDDFSESSVNATCQFLSHRSFTRLMSRVPQSCIGLLVPKLNTWTRVWLPEHSIFPALTAR